MMRTGWNR